MRIFPYVTVDVFTDQRFAGNPLAVVTNAQGLSDSEMQALATEFNYSETTFVLPPDDARHAAKVRVFDTTHELPFAGHPNVGTGYVLATQGRDRDGVLLFEELAGLVEVQVERDRGGVVTGATIAAPQTLSLGRELSAEDVAACVGLDAADIRVETHRPVAASVGLRFVLAEVTNAALSRAAPIAGEFRKVVDRSPQLGGELSIHLYAQDGKHRLRARMFSPLAGTYEDPATGSANGALAALLVSLSGTEDQAFEIAQGIEMGRPSLLHVTARRGQDGVRAWIRGSCVPVFRGEALLEV
jgi:trans-2,3-dihydro-3-hydroxyanthranilate isomerase